MELYEIIIIFLNLVNMTCIYLLKNKKISNVLFLIHPIFLSVLLIKISLLFAVFTFFLNFIISIVSLQGVSQTKKISVIDNKKKLIKLCIFILIGILISINIYVIENISVINSLSVDLPLEEILFLLLITLFTPLLIFYEEKR